MEEEIERVASRTDGAIMKFCRNHQLFHADELREYVAASTGISAPASADRVLRDLRERRRIDYAVVSRRGSLYQVFRVEGDEEGGAIMFDKQLQSHFDYGVLDEETRDFVVERVEKIRGLARMTAAAIVQTGQHLTEVKARLKHGQFLDWIVKEFGWAERSARRFMEVHDKFKTAKLADMEIDVSALYLIAAPKTPEPVRAEAIRRAEVGESVSHAGARALVGHFAKTGELPKAKVSLSELAGQSRAAAAGPARPPTRGKTPQKRTVASAAQCQCRDFYQNLLAEIKRRRIEAKAKREGRWFPDACMKADLVGILNWIEDEVQNFNQCGQSVKAREKARPNSAPLPNGQERNNHGQENHV